jgi:membrane protein implicated in regulation of membrane protease activity
MNIEILYWHWLIFGIVLILLEAVLVSFTVLWFGIGAVVVGILLWIFAGMPVGLQLLLWAFFSSLMAWLWFKYIKPLSIDKTKAGLSREAIVGQVGQVITLPVGNVRGKLRFDCG